MSGRVMIFQAGARVTDEAALTKLLESAPDSASVRLQLKEKFSGQFYNQETKRDHWLGSDGAMVNCITIAGVTAAQAAKMREIFEDRTDLILTAKVVARIAAHITGKDVELVS